MINCNREFLSITLFLVNLKTEFCEVWRPHKLTNYLVYGALCCVTCNFYPLSPKCLYMWCQAAHSWAAQLNGFIIKCLFVCAFYFIAVLFKRTMKELIVIFLIFMLLILDLPCTVPVFMLGTIHWIECKV